MNIVRVEDCTPRRPPNPGAAIVSIAARENADPAHNREIGGATPRAGTRRPGSVAVCLLPGRLRDRYGFTTLPPKVTTR